MKDKNLPTGLPNLKDLFAQIGPFLKMGEVAMAQQAALQASIDKLTASLAGQNSPAVQAAVAQAAPAPAPAPALTVADIMAMIQASADTSKKGKKGKKEKKDEEGVELKGKDIKALKKWYNKLSDSSQMELTDGLECLQSSKADYIPLFVRGIREIMTPGHRVPGAITLAKDAGLVVGATLLLAEYLG